jgi:hypothetical protein
MVGDGKNWLKMNSKDTGRTREISTDYPFVVMKMLIASDKTLRHCSKLFSGTLRG